MSLRWISKFVMLRFACKGFYGNVRVKMLVQKIHLTSIWLHSPRHHHPSFPFPTSFWFIGACLFIFFLLNENTHCHIKLAVLLTVYVFGYCMCVFHPQLCCPKLRVLFFDLPVVFVFLFMFHFSSHVWQKEPCLHISELICRTVSLKKCNTSSKGVNIVLNVHRNHKAY